VGGWGSVRVVPVAGALTAQNQTLGRISLESNVGNER
jgi:hypothetical protein